MSLISSLLSGNGTSSPPTAAEIIESFTGTPDGTKFLRDDGTLAAPSGGGAAMLALTSYHPTSQMTINATTEDVFADIDATNLAVTFTAPASGEVLVRLTGRYDAASATGYFWALREGTSVVARSVVRLKESSHLGPNAAAAIHISGLTPGNSYTWKWAHAGNTATVVSFLVGGVDDLTSASATWGPAIMEVWEVPL